jgi:hypothetical protein
VLNNPVAANDPYGLQAADQPKEEFYADGTDPETGAYESYSVTPDLEVHEYMEFEPDEIAGFVPKKNATPSANTDAQSPKVEFEVEPFDVDAWMAQVSEMLEQTETPEYKLALGLAMAEQARQAEFEREQKEEAELEKELPGFGASLIPFYGNGKSFLVHVKHGNYGRATFYGVMTILDIAIVKSLVVGVGKAAIKGGVAVLGRTAIAATTEEAVKEGGAAASNVLYHYTTEEGLQGIRTSNELRASIWKAGTKDVRYGNGQYLTDIIPGTRSNASLARQLIGIPNKYKFTHFVAIDVSGLEVIKGRAGVFVIPNEGPLDLAGRLIGSGAN